eukprot:NODE_55_length_29507_cov_0.809712.p10 type:complete len:351 gc:universal NODE_55_length_29507_cov_0.809712:22633-23685(+)
MKFKLISWNILAQTSIKTEQFPHMNRGTLKRKHRQPLIINEIVREKADIVVLQELDDPSFMVEKCGYSGYFEKKTQSLNGCGIFWNDKFKIKKSFIHPSIPFENIWEHDNAFLMGVILECDKNEIMVCTTHLYWHPMGDFARLRGMVSCLQYLSKFKKMPIIFAGDFNSTPDTAVYRLATHCESDLKLTRLQISELVQSYDEGVKRSLKRNPSSKFTELGDKPWKSFWIYINDLISTQEILTLKSSYSQYGQHMNLIDSKNRIGKPIHKIHTENTVFNIKNQANENQHHYFEPYYTNYCINFKACIDYIFYHNLNVTNILDLSSEIDVINGLPSADFPSDHLILGLEFTL